MCYATKAFRKEILDALTVHKDRPRNVPAEIDKGDSESVESFSSSIRNWLEQQLVVEEELDDGTKQKRLGQSASDLVQKLQKGDRSAVETIKGDQPPGRKIPGR